MISQYKDQNEIDSYNTIIKSFGEFINSNVDCDADEIKNSLMSLLRQISEADGQLSEKEEIEIDYIGNLLKVWLSVFSVWLQLAALTWIKEH